MSNTRERLATLEFDISILRAQLAELADLAEYDQHRMYLFRELVYYKATYDALRRKHSLRQRAVNQHDQPLYS